MNLSYLSSISEMVDIQQETWNFYFCPTGIDKVKRFQEKGWRSVWEWRNFISIASFYVGFHSSCQT